MEILYANNYRFRNQDGEGSNVSGAKIKEKNIFTENKKKCVVVLKRQENGSLALPQVFGENISTNRYGLQALG